MKDGFDRFLHEMKPYISSHRSRQFSAWQLLSQIPITGEKKILDLGCGDGYAIDYAMLSQKNATGIIFPIGLDICNQKKNPALELITYDGIRFPFKDFSFDIIYCNQVLEHVRYPDILIKEVERVLRNDGVFIGSVSHIEPYHAYSIFNWTPFGLVQVFLPAGLQNIRIFPGIDGLTLLLRRITLGRFGNYFFNHQSPGNIFIQVIGRILRFSHPEINAVMLSFCGQFSFCAKKKGREQQ